MFRHQVRLQLKTGALSLFSRKHENQILPILLEENGFREGNISVTRQHTTALENTFWNTEADAEEYQKIAYVKVLEILSDVLAIAPKAVISEVLG